MASRARERILCLCSALLRPLLQCCIQLIREKAVDMLKQAYKRVMKVIRELEHLL